MVVGVEQRCRVDVPVARGSLAVKATEVRPTVVVVHHDGGATHSLCNEVVDGTGTLVPRGSSHSLRLPVAYRDGKCPKRTKRGELPLGRDEHALELGVVDEAFHAELLADARGLVAAERGLRKDRAIRVDADRAGAKRARDP